MPAVMAMGARAINRYRDTWTQLREMDAESEEYQNKRNTRRQLLK
jgi:cell fate (sporulation/competence/biofilm development) regulator YlbF (YheA/YmcA/DUF963 family)